MNVTHGMIKSVLKALYDRCDEDNYNVYDAEDIAAYLGLSEDIVKEVFAHLGEGRIIA